MPATVPGGAPEAIAFSSALRAAIGASGLSLERIQHRLAVEGIELSIATLSNWQSGRSRPERPASLCAVRRLEELLGLPSAALFDLLPARRPRGRWTHHGAPAAPVESLWEDGRAVQAALSQLDTRCDELLTHLSEHTRLVVGPDRGLRRLLARRVVQAKADGADRLTVVYTADSLAGLPALRAGHPCRLGAVAAGAAETGVLAAELLFDRPLSRGATVIAEYELVYPEPFPPDTSLERKLRFPVREYTMQVQFAPETPAASCTSYVVLDGEPVDHGRRRLVPDSAGCVHTVTLNAGPGRYGIRWCWPR